MTMPNIHHISGLAGTAVPGEPGPPLEIPPAAPREIPETSIPLEVSAETPPEAPFVPVSGQDPDEAPETPLVTPNKRVGLAQSLPVRLTDGPASPRRRSGDPILQEGLRDEL
jgi:hypothetical protein